MKKLLLILLLFIPMVVWFILTFTAIIMEKICEAIYMAANQLEKQINI